MKSALHEAGHATIAGNCCFEFDDIAVVAGVQGDGSQFVGRVRRGRSWETQPGVSTLCKNRSLDEAELLIALAGPGAEFILTGKWPDRLSGSMVDYQRAYELAFRLRAHSEMKEVEAYVRDMKKQVVEMLKSDWLHVSAIASALESARFLSFDEVQATGHGFRFSNKTHSRLAILDD